MTEIQSLTDDVINLWADDKGPVALILKQKLLPIDGEGGIIFPPTYADIGYSIDVLSDGTKVAQIDSIASQANRMEPLFKEDKYKELVPQIEFDFGKDSDDQDRLVSLLDLAHRAGDAVVRSSDFAIKINDAFNKLLRYHDAKPLAELAPTSLVFGAWDSRGTHVKRPRLVRSFTRAENVDVLHSAAQYNSIWKLLSEEHKTELEKDKNSKKLADVGFKDVPSVFRKFSKSAAKEIRQFRDGRPNDDARVLGGVIANGSIYRHTTVNLVALRSLHAAGKTPEEKLEATKVLRHYLLGLALVAATADMEVYLREGCLLKYADELDVLWEVVFRRGQSQFFSLSSEKDQSMILEYAKDAAKKFQVSHPNEGKPYLFDIKKAKALLEKAKKEEDKAQKEETETKAEGG